MLTLHFLRRYLFYLLACFFMLVFTSSQIRAQKKGLQLIDSLQGILPSLPEDTLKARVLYKLSVTYYSINPDRGIEFGEQLLAHSHKIKYTLGLALANGALGINYSLGKSDGTKALPYFQQAMAINTQLKNRGGVASALSNMAVIYAKQANFSEALAYYQKAMQIHQELGNKQGVSTALANMANIYEDQLEYDKAIECHEKALQYYRESNNEMYAAIVLSNIGTNYVGKKDTERAKKCFEEANTLYAKNEHKLGLATNYVHLAALETDFEKSIELYRLAQKLKQELGGENNLHAIYSGLAKVYFDRGNLMKVQQDPQALSYLNAAQLYVDSAIWLGKQSKDMVRLQSDYVLSSEISQLLDNHSQALSAYKNYVDIKDCVVNIAHFKKITEAELQYEFQKKKIALDAEQERLNLEHNKKIELQQLKNEYAQKQAKAKSEKEKEILRYQEKLKQQQIEEKFKIETAKLEIVHQQQVALLEQQKLNKEKAYHLSKLKNEKKINDIRYRRNILALALALFSISGLIFFVQFKRHQVMKRKLAVEQTKTHISKDLHDDIGTMLSAISLQTEVIKKRLKNNEDYSVLLNNINESSKEMIGKMSDIVWSLSLEDETIFQLIERLENYCKITVLPIGINYTIDTHGMDARLNLNSGMIKDLYLSLKEAVNNAVKYAQCTSILVRFHCMDRQLRVDVQDNGIGYDVAQTKKVLGGRGIKNMIERTERNAGKFQMQSNQPTGTKVTFKFSL